MTDRAAPTTADRAPDRADFDAFASTRWTQLMRSAWLLTGEWSAAEDLVQSALLRAWQSWSRVSAADEPIAYVRRIVTNEYLSRRRIRSASERPVDVLPDSPAGDEADLLADRLRLVAALDELAPLQRAAIVLRYFDDLSIEAAAEALGCSVGTVKSSTSRALRKLRASRHFTDLEGDVSDEH